MNEKLYLNIGYTLQKKMFLEDSLSKKIRTYKKIGDFRVYDSSEFVRLERIFYNSQKTGEFRYKELLELEEIYNNLTGY